MEHDASWLLDIEGKRGMEMGGCCLNMALRDQARFGQLFLQDGMWEGERVLPEGWVARATVPSEAHLRWDAPSPYAERGYQYQWWSIGTGAVSAEGVHGQFIYVDPAREVVIAKASSWPEAWTDEDGAMAFAAFDAIARHLAD
jgi:CubicO group peptidase (beta-lactamase class C family)